DDLSNRICVTSICTITPSQSHELCGHPSTDIRSLGDAALLEGSGAGDQVAAEASRSGAFDNEWLAAVPYTHDCIDSPSGWTIFRGCVRGGLPVGSDWASNPHGRQKLHQRRPSGPGRSPGVREKRTIRYAPTARAGTRVSLRSLQDHAAQRRGSPVTAWLPR